MPGLVQFRVVDREAERSLERLSVRADIVVRRALLKIGFTLGRKIAQNVMNFKQTAGTGRLARSFLVPVVDGVGVILGKASPVYAAIHEYGGTIRAKYASFLVFMTPDGEWHSVKEVTISEKRYARDAIEEMEGSGEALTILGLELRGEFEGGT